MLLNMNTGSDNAMRKFMEGINVQAKQLKPSLVEGMRPLAPGFSPGPFDVICARGRAAKTHSGNVRYKHIIELNLSKYSAAASKLDKSIIVSNIVESIREASPNGGFIKEEDGEWFEVGDHIAREKVGQGLRDLLHTKYKSSTKAKKRRRREQQIKLTYDSSSLSTMNGNIPMRLNKLNKAAVAGKDSDSNAETTSILKNTLPPVESANLDSSSHKKRKSVAERRISFAQTDEPVATAENHVMEPLPLSETFRPRASMVRRIEEQFSIDSSEDEEYSVTAL